VTFKNVKAREDDASTVGQLASLIKRHFFEGQKGRESVASEEQEQEQQQEEVQEVVSESDSEKCQPGRPVLTYEYLYRFHATQLFVQIAFPFSSGSK